MPDLRGITIKEPGSLFSLAVQDHAVAGLSTTRERFSQSLALLDPARIPAYLLSELNVYLHHLFSILEGLLDRKRAQETNEERIETELEQCRERFAELPEVHAFINPMLAKTISQVRDNIYRERSELLAELRKMRTDYWKDIQDQKVEAAEVYENLFGMVRKLEALGEQPLKLPAFSALFGFLDAPKPVEFYVKQPRRVIPSSMVSTRIP